MKRQEKPFFVENLTAKIKAATSFVLLDYTGLSVKMQQELKKRLKEVGAEMTVVKNTLLKLAGTKAKVPKESLSDTILQGPTAIVITETDPIAPLQILAKFIKEFGIPQLKVGIVEGNFQDKIALEKLSTLPNKETLFAQTVGYLKAPLYGLTNVLQGNLQKLIWILKTKTSV